ncbi:unnamed protein product, partial [Ectocarpus sp. 12 AP-2014]
ELFWFRPHLALGIWHGRGVGAARKTANTSLPHSKRNDRDREIFEFVNKPRRPSGRLTSRTIDKPCFSASFCFNKWQASTNGKSSRRVTIFVYRSIVQSAAEHVQALPPSARIRQNIFFILSAKSKERLAIGD